MGEPTFDAGAECEMAFGGGGMSPAEKALLSMVGIADGPIAIPCGDLLLRREFGLL